MPLSELYKGGQATTVLVTCGPWYKDSVKLDVENFALEYSALRYL